MPWLNLTSNLWELVIQNNTDSINIPLVLQKPKKDQASECSYDCGTHTQKKSTISLINQTAVRSIFHHPIKWCWPKLVSFGLLVILLFSHYIHLFRVSHTLSSWTFLNRLRNKKKRWPSWCLSPGSFMKPFMSAKNIIDWVNLIFSSEAFPRALIERFKNIANRSKY